MRTALSLGSRGLGTVWPNPAVGCVLVSAGRVVARGWTQPGGRPHGETEALAWAGARARGTTAYISLEPCNHRGQTPPCSEALIGAGIGQAVISVEDPDPRVSGAGIARLRAAGIEVTTGVLAREAAALNAGFFLRVQAGRPLMTLKVATSIDGRIATNSGESQWITGEQARAWAHALRARHDAVMVGIGTAIADDPRLTCRLPGLEGRSPIRIVIDGRLRLPLTSPLVVDAADIPTWVICRADADSDRRRAFEDNGVEIIAVSIDADGYPDIKEAMRLLGARGLTRVLVEGGSRLAATLFRHGLVDRLAWFRASQVIGGDGIPAAVGFGVERLTEARNFVRLSASAVGDDLLETYARQNHHTG